MGRATYVKQFIVIAALMVLLAGALNLAIDHYGLFGSTEITGVNAKKPAAYTHTRLAKEARTRRLRPVTVLAGNSRVDVGFNPESTAWPAGMRPVVNLGVPGEGVEGSIASLRFALAHTPAKTILVGLDFTDFIALDRGGGADVPQSARTWEFLPETMLSTSAIADSLWTVTAQADPFSPAMTAAGFNPMADHTAIIAREGHFALADQKNRDNLHRLVSRSLSIYHPDGTLGAPLRQWQMFLEEASATGINVVAVIYPLHADFLQSIVLSGRDGAYRQWKQTAAELFFRHANPGWALWDFGVFAAETEEEIPARGDRTSRMQFWWEPGHFKAALGDVVLGQIFGYSDGFGVQLTADTIGDHLDRQQRLAGRYAVQRRHRLWYLYGLCPAGACERPPDTPRITLKM